MSKVHYTKSGSGAPVILLHGWGCDHSIFEGLIKFLESSFSVYAIDFNGFGESPEPNSVWGVEEYTQSLEKFIADNNINNPILIGHSFGGRVAILYSARNSVRKMVLTGCAGVKPLRPLAYYIKIYFFKLAKRILSLPILKDYKNEILSSYVKKIGSSDYRSATPVMKKVLSKVVNEDLKKEMKDVSAPTLLIWGEKDTATPLKDGLIIEQLIPDSGLVVFKDSGHYAFLDEPSRFNTILENFLIDK